ncbi:MAG: S1C family serine protease [Gemmataceae bacterium]
MKQSALLLFVGACACAGGSAAVVTLRTGNPAMAQTQSFESSSNLDSVVRLGLVFQTVAEKVSPAVVSVESTFPAKQTRIGGQKGKMLEESGSGFVVQFPNQKGYYVLTNNHVIADAKPNQITIRLADQRLLRPVRTLTDPETDIALLVLSPKIKTMPTATIGNSDRVRVGQWVLAFGSPFGLSRTVTHGILSARERGEVSLGNTIRIKDFLQTDAAINPGSSGGPLVNLKGEVIGINTAIASLSGTNSGVAFSIPMNLVKRITRQLLENGRVSRGYLGMQLAQSFDAQDALRLGLNRVQGAWVERVYPQTPAEKAGLKPNDVVLKVEDVVIRNENHMINLISKLSPGQRIELYVWRDQTMQRVNAVIGDWNKAQNRFQAQ